MESWICQIPDDDPLVIAHTQLRDVFSRLGWPAEHGIRYGTSAGLRMMLVNDYDRLSQIVETDMDAIPTAGSEPRSTCGLLLIECPGRAVILCQARTGWVSTTVDRL